MKSGWAYAFSAIGLLILALGVYVVLGTVRSAATPIQSLSQQIGTQIAQVLHPTPTVRPDPVAIVREVRALARLETIQYTVERVIIAEAGQGPFGFLFGDRLLLVAHGMVIAGVDLGRLQPADIEFDDLGRVYFRLPEPEVFVAALDNDKSYVYDRETGLLTRGNVQLEAEARRSAEASIRQTALEDGILEQARVNAESYLYGLLRTLGYTDVVFRAPPAAALPTATLTPIPLSSPTP
jgi:hypothetical protein